METTEMSPQQHPGTRGRGGGGGGGGGSSRNGDRLFDVAFPAMEEEQEHEAEVVVDEGGKRRKPSAVDGMMAESAPSSSSPSSPPTAMAAEPSSSSSSPSSPPVEGGGRRVNHQSRTTTNNKILLEEEGGEGTEDPLSLILSPSDSSSLDPFGIGSLTQQHQQNYNDTNRSVPTDSANAGNNNNNNNSRHPQIRRGGGGGMIRRGGTTATTTASAATTNPMLALPPKMLVKLTTYEEVTSVATVLDPGTSRISVEGSVYVQLHSSDARGNAPFRLIPVAMTEENEEVVTIKPNNRYSRKVDAMEANSPVTVSIPKRELGYVPVVHYSYERIVHHMPVLLERKVTIHEDSCRIAYQVRTKLSNRGDLKDFTLAVAVPEKVDADSIEVLKGDGVYDGLKRIIKYKVAHLPKGESFMVSAQAKLWNALKDDEEIHFPVVMRCTSSEDQISNVDFNVTEAPGQPSSLSVHKAQSFRLLHRLS